MATDLILKAPEGKFRVVGVDTFDGTDWVDGDYDTYEKARLAVIEQGGKMLKTHVYNDKAYTFLKPAHFNSMVL